MTSILFELRLALRRLSANKGFSAIAIVSLAFGIGATTVFFSLVNSTLLKPLPGVEKPGELYSLADPRFGAPVLSYPNYIDVRDRNTAFAGVMAYRIAPVSVSLSNGVNSRQWTYLVTGNYFELLGVKPALGRLLEAEDDVKRGGHPVVVLGYRYWKSQFASDPGVVGRTIKVNSYPFTVVGVAAEGFQGTERFYAPEMYFPMAMVPQLEPSYPNYLDSRQAENIFILARLKAGITVEQAKANLDALAKKLGEDWPKVNEGLKITLTEPGWAGDFLRGGVIGFSTILIAVAALLLLVVCVNLASLLLAQAAERRKEIAVRLAIGAGRGVLIRQLLIETLVLSLIGGGIGLLGAYWAVGVLSHLKPPVDFALETSISIDGRVLLFSAVVSVLTALLFGLTPAWQATRTELVSALKNEVTDVRTRRWPLRDWMVGAQITLSVVLLSASGLMLRSLQKALEIDAGIDTHHAATLGFDMGIQGYPEAKGKQFLHELSRRVKELPGVQAASIGSGLPLSLGFSNSGVWDTDQPEPTASQIQSAQVFEVAPDFFRALGTRMVAGREYADSDDEKAPRRMIVNETFARKILGLKQPALAIGRRATMSRRVHEIVGVVADGKYVSLAEAPKPVAFTSIWQSYSADVRVIARATPQTSEQQLLRSMHQLVAGMDPEMTLYGEETLEQHMNLPLLPSRVAAVTLSVFGSVTLALAAIGIYGVMAFAVSRRTREIGIRMAIGAGYWQIAWLIGKRALVLVGVAAALGSGLGLLIAGQMSPLLLGVSPRDPMVHGTGVLLIVMIGLVACWRPAQRAATLDPNLSLRRE